MSTYTRREILRLLSSVLPAALLGCYDKDVFDEELVCVHVFQPGHEIPRPLLAVYDDIPTRSKLRDLFQLGIPELILCTTSTDFLSLFQYFWPVTRYEFQRIDGLISARFSKSELTGKGDVVDFTKYLENHRDELAMRDKKTAIIFTFNDFTKYYTPDLVELWRNYGIKEFVLFKDPSRSPYLCSYPALQKGFKRPPPI
jgi:hypothetical protein